MAVDEIAESVRALRLNIAVDHPMRRITIHGRAQHKNAGHHTRERLLAFGDDEPLKLRADV